jgi:hypothetical protein
MQKHNIILGDQLLFDTNTQIAYHLLTRLYQKHTQFQDWIVLLHTPDQLLFDTSTRLA